MRVISQGIEGGKQEGIEPSKEKVLERGCVRESQRGGGGV